MKQRSVDKEQTSDAEERSALFWFILSGVLLVLLTALEAYV